MRPALDERAAGTQSGQITSPGVCSATYRTMKAFLSRFAGLAFVGLLQLNAAPAFPLKVGDNHRYLVDSNGAPFFVMGDTPWFLQKLPLEEVRRIMDDRKAKGFNTLFLEILDDSAMPSRDANGQVAFEPEKDITKPVEAYWRYADAVMDEAEQRGFSVIMSELWYGAGKGLWMHHITPESAAAYGR